jgi:hypothetical protein
MYEIAKRDETHDFVDQEIHKSDWIAIDDWRLLEAQFAVCQGFQSVTIFPVNGFLPQFPVFQHSGFRRNNRLNGFHLNPGRYCRKLSENRFRRVVCDGFNFPHQLK